LAGDDCARWYAGCSGSVVSSGQWHFNCEVGLAERAEAVAPGAGGAEQSKSGVVGAGAGAGAAAGSAAGNAGGAGAPAAPGAKFKALPKGKLILIGVIVAGAALGGALGAFIVGPKVVGARAGGTPAIASAGSAHGAAAAAHAKPEEHEPGFVLEYDNIIVNPAGAEGSHFLMVTVGLELSDQKASQLLEEREIQVRDEIITVLANQTMETLMQPGARDEVKKQLAEVLIPMAGHPKWIEIYLPQFVIQ
jgi:flagellar FliL protein